MSPDEKTRRIATLAEIIIALDPMATTKAARDAVASAVTALGRLLVEPG